MSITIGGIPLASEPAAGGLPVGGTAADVLAGDGTWKAATDVLHDGLAAFTGDTAGAMSGISGPRIERTISWDGAKQWRLRVTPAAVAFTSATPNGALYLRNSDGSLFVYTSLRAAGATGNIFALNAAGLIGGPGASQIPWAGTGTIELRFTDAGTMSYCGLDAAGTLVVISDVTAANAVLPFTPTHCGVLAQTGEASVGTFSFSGLVMEAVG